MLDGQQLDKLFSQVFGYDLAKGGQRIAFMLDVPRLVGEDNEDWRARRALVVEWANDLSRASTHACSVYAYPSVGAGNADLTTPSYCLLPGQAVPNIADELLSCGLEGLDFSERYASADYWLALTEHSATAPLKMAAAKHGFRAATMPGFTLDMLPALALDIDVIDARVQKLANALTLAQSAELLFEARGKRYQLFLDLRERKGFASSGKLTRAGQAGNLPSGEAYIVPFEGDLSKTEGFLPIQRGDDLAVCHIKANVVVAVEGDNPWAEELKAYIAKDPARANVAELGLGVLGDSGIQAVGRILLDEKLATHIALGRSEHLGGSVSPSHFLTSENVSHIDYVYHKKLMPEVSILRGTLNIDDVETAFVIDDKMLA